MAFVKNAPANRLIGDLPKVGIRPTIDGRMNGVRESLEEQTMGMALACKELIEANLKHSCGIPVECVIADTTIGGVAEAAACAAKFKKAGVGLTITVTPCWCYGSETMDMDPHMPKAVWGFNGTERPGAVYLAAVLAGHAQKGLPAFSIYGRDVLDADDKSIPCDVKEKILRFVRAGVAVATLRGKSYLSMGSTSMGIAGSMVNPDFFEQMLGMRCESVDMSEFVRRWEEGIYDKAEFERALEWTKEHCKEGFDKNINPKNAETKAKTWETVVKMAIIARDLMIGNPKLAEMGFGEEAMGHNAIAAGFQGQRQWTDHFPNGDFMEAILNSSFDWNGIREAFVLATENDCLNGVAMLFGHLLTGSASVFADVRTYWSPDAVKRVSGWSPDGAAQNGFIHLINSGSAALDGSGYQTGSDGGPCMKPWWDIDESDADACLSATTWHYGDLGYFRGGGYSSKFLSRGGMPVTMVRINMVKGLGPVLHIAEGETVTLPQNVNDMIDKRTDPTWPTTWFAPRLTGEGAFADVYSVMANWGANHGSLTYGHVGADLITLASMLRIPVCMHNVPGCKVFRPASWASFGTIDIEGADYRACAAYGALYK